MFTIWQVSEFDQTCFEPLRVRFRRSQLALNFFVVHNALLFSVNEQHSARLQPALFHNFCLINIDNAYFTSHDHHIVIGYPVATRTKSVSIEHCTNQRSVSESNACRAVPRLHQRCVVTIKRTLVFIHRRVVFPCFRNHHQHCVRQRTSAQVQQLQHLIKRCRVRTTHRTDRKGSFESWK